MSSDIENIWKIFEDLDDINLEKENKISQCVNNNCKCNNFSLKDCYYICDICHTIQDKNNHYLKTLNDQTSLMQQ